MSSFQDCLEELKALRAKHGYSNFDLAVKHLNRSRLETERPEKRKPMSRPQRLKLYARQNGICPRCEQPIPFNEMTDDHLIALAQGGGNELNRRRLICKKCNSEKGAGSLIEESKSGHGTALQQIENTQALHNEEE